MTARDLFKVLECEGKQRILFMTHMGVIALTDLTLEGLEKRLNLDIPIKKFIIRDNDIVIVSLNPDALKEFPSLNNHN